MPNLLNDNSIATIKSHQNAQAVLPPRISGCARLSEVQMHVGSLSAVVPAISVPKYRGDHQAEMLRHSVDTERHSFVHKNHLRWILLAR